MDKLIMALGPVFAAGMGIQQLGEILDPILEKISREGIQSLSWTERRTLTKAQEKITGKAQAG